jgi:hypothetical protein
LTKHKQAKHDGVTGVAVTSVTRGQLQRLV